MAAKNSTKTAAQTKTSTISGINVSKMVVDNLTAAKERLGAVTVDLELLDVDILAATLAENIIILADDVNNHLSTAVKGKKISVTDAKRQLDAITLPYLVKLLDETILLVQSTEQFGTTTLTVKSLKSIRITSEKIKEDAFQLFVEDTLYKVRNPS